MEDEFWSHGSQNMHCTPNHTKNNIYIHSSFVLLDMKNCQISHFPIGPSQWRDNDIQHRLHTIPTVDIVMTTVCSKTHGG